MPLATLMYAMDGSSYSSSRIRSKLNIFYVIHIPRG